MEIQDAYKKMAEQLKEWIAQIELLEDDMENAGAEMTAERTDEFRE